MNEKCLSFTVFFDLDGTLIDSSKSILQCYEKVLEEAGLHPERPLDDSLIGPPLRQTLTALTGIAEGCELERLAISFQDIYDSHGYRKTEVYPGIESLLERLYCANVPMVIATNKRRCPTMKILKHLDWMKYFISVGTLDSQSPAFSNKGALIKNLLENINISTQTSPYIGDKWEDGEAASENKLSFIAAGWGYGDWEVRNLPSSWTLARTPDALADVLLPT